MGAGRNIESDTRELCDAIAAAPCALILVSNEVGLGIVPDNALARAFRDHQGRLNQAVAATVERVEFIAAGLPMRLKG
jgi:adenosylcobinamide kinase/adenosylcobinamide-phosphate guanylyltransferase